MLRGMADLMSDLVEVLGLYQTASRELAPSGQSAADPARSTLAAALTLAPYFKVAWRR